MASESLKNVRIVRLPAMDVAAYCAVSETPERDCAEVFNAYVLENGLHLKGAYRCFGFNNPSPSESSPVYGYELWASLPEGFAVSEPMQIKRFGGGLFASISSQMDEIGERWMLLYEWCQNSADFEYDHAGQWLEECSMGLEDFMSEEIADACKQLDLLAPIKRK
ncbi:MAG: GyrI-like domain-containing protein [Eubacteriaceae bacterium]|jgi:hypothetical protein|nr:GyrI-like domain-containing protein [Eubacteriaceae bacterium]